MAEKRLIAVNRAWEQHQGARRMRPDIVRLATYNVQWFDHLFDDRDRLWNDDGRGGREGVTRAEQMAGLGRVFRALDADAVLVVEAPDARHRTATAPPRWRSSPAASACAPARC